MSETTTTMASMDRLVWALVSIWALLLCSSYRFLRNAPPNNKIMMIHLGLAYAFYFVTSAMVALLTVGMDRRAGYLHVGLSRILAGIVCAYCSTRVYGCFGFLTTTNDGGGSLVKDLWKLFGSAGTPYAVLYGILAGIGIGIGMMAALHYPNRVLGVCGILLLLGLSWIGMAYGLLWMQNMCFPDLEAGWFTGLATFVWVMGTIVVHSWYLRGVRKSFPPNTNRDSNPIENESNPYGSDSPEDSESTTGNGVVGDAEELRILNQEARATPTTTGVNPSEKILCCRCCGWEPSCNHETNEGDSQFGPFLWCFLQKMMGLFLALLCILNIGATKQQHAALEELPRTFQKLYPPTYQNGTMCGWNESSAKATIRTFDTLHDLYDANYSVVHCGACGACSNWNDLSIQYTKRNLLSVEARKCSAKSAFGAPLSSLIDCNQKQIGFTRDCASVWAWDYLNTRKHCGMIFLQSFFANTLGDLSVGTSKDATTAMCDEAWSGPVFASRAGAIRRRMNIESDIERPLYQQCVVAMENWTELFGEMMGNPER